MDWVQQMVLDAMGKHLEIGMMTKHPDGRTVKIVDGQFFGSSGGLSNWWTWQEVKEDGYLCPKESGYGWEVEE